MTFDAREMSQGGVRLRVLAASLIGSAIEWFDYFLYGTVTLLVFDKLFFPTEDPLIGKMLAWLTFSLTFFVRPIGGVIFSHIGDKIGRKKTLVITLSVMGLATACIGLVPSYDMIGVWAPILLILFRIFQGLGLSGEWGGSLLLAYEYAPKNRKGLFGSIPHIGVPIGLVMASGVVSLVALMPDDMFMEIGWRIPFVLSLFLVFLGLWIRKGIDETPEFQHVQSQGEVAHIPLAETLRHHWREVVIAIGVKMVDSGPFYIFSTFIIGYVTGTLLLDRSIILNAITIASLISIIMIPIMGLFSDRIGRKNLFLMGSLATLLFAFPYFILLDQQTVGSIVIATVIAIGINWSIVYAVLGTLMAELFSARVRYTGITLGYQIGAAIAGLGPLVATWAMAKSGGAWWPIALYVAFWSIISIISVIIARNIAYHEPS